MVHGGVKTNVIPDEVVLEVDIRTLPGQTADDVDRLLADALGPLAARRHRRGHARAAGDAEPDRHPPAPPPCSVPRARAYPDATLLPRITAGGTDATFFRGKGSVAYGFGLLSRQVTYEDFATRFHGHDERIDVDSLAPHHAVLARPVPGRAGLIVPEATARDVDPGGRRLSGRTVVVARAAEQAGGLVERLRALGADVVEVPMIAIVDPADGGAGLAAAAARLDETTTGWS